MQTRAQRHQDHRRSRVSSAPRRLRWIFIGCTVVSALLGPSATSASAGTGTPGRAGVVVDLGNGTVRRVGITFDGNITGFDALQAAGFAPVARTYGGLGGAVCALRVADTVLGCPDDTSCLTCAAPNYWVYFRAPAGSTRFTVSRAGAGATTVQDGDVEGWRWGTGSPPQFTSVDSFFPPPVTTTTTAAVTTTSTSTPPVATTTTRVSTTTTPSGAAATSDTPPSPHQTAGHAVRTTGRSPSSRPLSAAATGPAPMVERRAHAVTATVVTDAPSRAAEHRGPPVVRTTTPNSNPLGTVAFLSTVVALTAMILMVRRGRRTKPTTAPVV